MVDLTPSNKPNGAIETTATHARSINQDHASTKVRGRNAYDHTAPLDTSGQYPGHNVSKLGIGHNINSRTAPHRNVEKLRMVETTVLVKRTT